MKIYVGAAYERAEEMQGVRRVLAGLGHTVTSRWIDQHEGEMDEAAPEAKLNADPGSYTKYAITDLDDIDQAEMFLMFTGGATRGGYHTELGYALARDKYIVGVGVRQNVFHSDADEWYPDWAGLVRAWTPLGASSHGMVADVRDSYSSYLPVPGHDHPLPGRDLEHPHGYWEAGDLP